MVDVSGSPIEVNREVAADTRLEFRFNPSDDIVVGLAELIGNSAVNGYVAVRPAAEDRPVKFPKLPDDGDDDPATSSVAAEPENYPIVASPAVGDARYVMAVKLTPDDTLELGILNTDGANPHDFRFRVGTGSTIEEAQGGA